MGLDQYASMGKENDHTFFRWRKHNRLQGWMEKLYHEKGGNDEFNCVDLELDLDDIEKLEAALLDKALPETDGFFFGPDSYGEDYLYHGNCKTKDLTFIEEAKKILENGDRVYYSCWW